MHAALRTFEFVERVAASDNAGDIAALLLSEAEQLGFSGLAMGWLPPPDSAEKARFEVAALPPEYFRRYAENHYERDSAIVSHMQTTTAPFRWDEVKVDVEAQPIAHKILQEAWDFDVRWGWSIPIYSQHRLTGFVTTSAALKIDDGMDTDQLHLMTLCAHSRILDLQTASRAALPILSEREREVVTWLAAGKTADDVSCILRISPRTVHAHIAAAGHKFGTSNSTHTVVEAIRRKQISI
ncbi:transcriptional regulator, LuxR family [Devosia sp. YR412]|uniref:helix-turn-helix transcriptional regulator n=1 Tax=Devosia sp. YR412 TaxID=1881030 RepID=UPI0008B4A1C4|nr:LuxR family transcriptional regulator [Devosia sp. YR412]SEQ48562.1 transcriptional regulator, LuxR family [Devosia sp. YR412]